MFYNADGSQRGVPLAEQREEVRSLAFSNKADIFASVGGDDKVRLWTLDGSPRPSFFKGHTAGNLGDGIEAVSFFPKGDRIATAGADGTVRFWDLDGLPLEPPLLITPIEKDDGFLTHTGTDLSYCTSHLPQGRRTSRSAVKKSIGELTTWTIKNPMLDQPIVLVAIVLTVLLAVFFLYQSGRPK